LEETPTASAKQSIDGETAIKTRAAKSQVDELRPGSGTASFYNSVTINQLRFPILFFQNHSKLTVLRVSGGMAQM